MVPISVATGEKPSLGRYGFFVLMLAFLLVDLAIGVWEMGGWGAFAKASLVPADPGILAVISTYIGAFGMLTGMLWAVLFFGVVASIFVVMRMLRVRESFVRWRLGLAIVGYFLFTGGLSYYATNGWTFPAVPNPGGTGLPAWDLYTGLALLVYTVLAFLFGRVAYCGWYCPTAVFWGGIGQKALPFNLDAEKGARISKIVIPITSALFVGTSLLSILDTFKIIKFSIFGSDPAVFFSGLWWMVLWYVLIVLIPFTGVRFFSRFLCPMGAFNGLIGSIGMGRVQARSKETCVSCQSHPCSSACEMSIQPHELLRAKGEIRRIACVGCGNCLEACPHGNLYYYHFGTWVMEIFGGKKTPLSASGRQT